MSLLNIKNSIQLDFKKYSIILIVGIILNIACLQKSHAEQALVRSYDQPELSIGQSYLTHYGDKCIAILPEHVANEAEIPSFLKEGNKGLLGEAETITVLGDDIAFANLVGRITTDCGYSITSISRAIDSTLQNQGLGTIRSIGSDGAIINMPVAIIDNAGGNHLFIKPSLEKEQIRKGQSGSMLIVNKQPIGMLISVSKRGVGTVFRLDSLLSRVEKHLAKVAKLPTKVYTSSKSKNLASAENGGKITGWSVNSIDSKHRVSNLIDDRETDPWSVKAKDWPVEIEIDLAGGKNIINSIWLDSVNIPEVERPNRVEIFVNLDSDKKSWRSLSSYDVKYGDKGISIFNFAPIWARQIKISIAEKNETKIISLRKISVFKP